jgi:hypothetical protein
MRLIAFIISLLLLAGTVDPTQGWLIALTAVTGIAVFRPRFWHGLTLRPAVDVRLAAFILATLMLTGVADTTKDWLIGLTIVTGVAMVMPRIIHIDLFGEEPRRSWCDWTWDVRSTDGSWNWRRQGDWGRWERDFDREMELATKRWEEETTWH